MKVSLSVKGDVVGDVPEGNNRERRRRALVTGASSGIGAAFVWELVRRGFDVIAVARRSERLEEMAASCLPHGRIMPFKADLTKSHDRERLIDLARENRIQFWVNNAGVGGFGDLTTADIVHVNTMIELNIVALTDLSHAFMIQAGSNDILINVSSTLSFLPFPPSPVYAATKAFVTSLTESLWFEGRRRGVRVLNLCPGATQTEFIDSAERASGGPGGTPPGFMTQTPETVVNLAFDALGMSEKPTVICGFVNKLIAALPRFLTRRALATVLGAIGAGRSSGRSRSVSSRTDESGGGPDVAPAKVIIDDSPEKGDHAVH